MKTSSSRATEALLPLKFNSFLEMIMNLSKNVILLGPTLMALSGYGIAAPVSDASEEAAGATQAVVVTGVGDHGSDPWIRAEVQKRINERPSLRFFNIVVYAAQQEVYLKGLVDSTMDRELGEAIARTVPNVKNVYNDLAISGA
jgi:osmotically-inducible protein OsmY